MPSQAGDPVGSPSVRVHHPDRRPPASAPKPSLRSLVPGSQGSPTAIPAPKPPPPSRRARQGISAKASPRQEGNPKAGRTGLGVWVGSPAYLGGRRERKAGARPPLVRSPGSTGSGRGSARLAPAGPEK